MTEIILWIFFKIWNQNKISDSGNGYDPVDSKPTYVKKTDENGESIVIGESVTTTLKDPQGNVRKITTIESYDADKGIESWKHIL